MTLGVPGELPGGATDRAAGGASTAALGAGRLAAAVVGCCLAGAAGVPVSGGLRLVGDDLVAEGGQGLDGSWAQRKWDADDRGRGMRLEGWRWLERQPPACEG